MLDHLSHGRLDIGVGRGVSPYELEFHNVVHDNSRDIFFEAYECVKTGLVSETFSFKSSRYLYNDVPIALRPLQQPHPPFWYASSSEIGSTWAGEHGLHYVTLGPNRHGQGQHHRVQDARWQSAASRRSRSLNLPAGS